MDLLGNAGIATKEGAEERKKERKREKKRYKDYYYLFSSFPHFPKGVPQH